MEEKGFPAIYVRHDSTGQESILIQGKPGFDFMDEVKPTEGEQVITKHVNSAFTGTELEDMLRNIDADAVYICELTTDHCVSTTARMSGNLGFNALVVEDGCATYPKSGPGGKIIDAETLHIANLAPLNGEFARVMESGDIAFLP